jgi:Tol biopolymer transport system component
MRVEQRFKELKRVSPPDLWPAIERREPRPPRREIPWGRLATAALALMLAAAGFAFAAGAFFRDGGSRERSAAPTLGRLAIVVHEEGVQHGIYLINEDGTEMTRLLEGRTPAWSPDGSMIAFRRGNPNRGGGVETTIYVANADGSNATSFSPDVYGEASGEGGPPVWSPDGSLIAFDTLGGIYVMEPDGSNLRRVTRYEGDLSCYDLQPSWSPDGSKIVFAVLCDGGNEGIWTVNVDGTEREQLTAPGGGLTDLSQPAWSPNGTAIAFQGARPTGSDGAYEEDIYLVDADGSNVRRLTDGSIPVGEPAWSPDGSKIAYTRWGTFRVIVMDADGSNARAITPSGVTACCPAWRPVD